MFGWLKSWLGRHSVPVANKTALRTYFLELGQQVTELNRAMNHEFQSEPWLLLWQARHLEKELIELRRNGAEEVHDQWFPHEQRTRLKIGLSIETVRRSIHHAEQMQAIDTASAARRPLSLNKGKQDTAPPRQSDIPASGSNQFETQSRSSIDDVVAQTAFFDSGSEDSCRSTPSHHHTSNDTGWSTTHSHVDTSYSSSSYSDTSSPSDSGSSGGSCD
jgi:hypothetical protein